MTLNEYRLHFNLSYENLARLLDFTTNKTYRICLDQTQIKLQDATIISEKTGGLVSLQDLLPKC